MTLGNKKRSRTNFYSSIIELLRKVRDSNPRYHETGIPDFESSAFGHSANLPFMHAKLIIKIVNGACNPNN